MGVEPVRRAGTWTVLATMVVIAVVVAGGLVGWIRLTAPSAAEPAPATLVEEVPETFPGGFAPAPVPDGVAEAVDGPVVGVVSLDDPPADANLCGFDEGAGDRDLLWALVTPDGLQTAYLSDEPDWMAEPDEHEVGASHAGEATPWLDEPVPGPTPQPEPPSGEGQRYLETCVVQWQQGRWVGGGGMGMSVPAGGPIPADVGTGSSCCDPQGFATASAMTAPAAGAAWLLQDRGGYWLAYPAEGLDVIPLTWRYRENRFGGGHMRATSTHVLSVDADGTVLDERYVSG